MKNNNSRFPWFGLALIVIGAAILLRKLNILDVHFSQILWPLVMLSGFISVTRGFTSGRRGKIFFGTILFLFGLFFFLHTIDSIDLPWYLFFPASCMIIGMGFLMTYLQKMRDWYFLVLSLFFTGIGVMAFMTEYGYLYGADVLDTIHVYWPVVLILVGLGIIFRKKDESPAVHTS